jgi:hypothetical protein
MSSLLPFLLKFYVSPIEWEAGGGAALHDLFDSANISTGPNRRKVQKVVFFLKIYQQISRRRFFLQYTYLDIINYMNFY